jgi:hypothetical protein
MMHIFECHLVAGSDPSTLLSDEALRETQAQVMTADEARAVGFGKFGEPKDGGEVRLVAVAARDSQWIHRVMERSPIVTSYKVHEVG